MSWVPVAGTRDDGHLDPALDEPVTGVPKRRQIAVGGRAAVAEILDVLGVPGVALKPAEPQADAFVRSFREGRCRLRIAGAGAMQPDIDIDHHIEHESGRCGGGLEGVQIVHVIGHHHERLVVAAERHQAVDLGGRHDGRGDEQSLDSPRRQRLRLAQGGAADAERAGVQLAARDLHALVGLRVGAEGDTLLCRVRRHRGDVALHRVEIEHQSGRDQAGPRFALIDQRFVRPKRRQCRHPRPPKLPRGAPQPPTFSAMRMSGSG